MENFKKDLDSSSFQSNAEMQFLEQVKECRDHLYCMEKLLFDLQQIPGSEKEIKKSDASLSDRNQLPNETSNPNSSFPDLQVLMQEFETKVNSKINLTMDNDSAITSKEEAIQIQLDAINNDNTSSPLTFVIQVPNNIFSLLNKSNSDQPKNFSSHSPKNKLLKLRRKAKLTLLLDKLFKRKKNSSLPTIKISTNISENLELFQLLKMKHEESIANTFQSSNASCLNFRSIVKDGQHFPDKNSISDNFIHKEMDNKLCDSKNKPTVIIPITYNFDDKSSTIIKPNLTVQLETIMPQTELTTCSNCIKITNEIPISCSKKSSIFEKETENSKIEMPPKTDKQPTEILLETLIKTLLKTTERLDNLERLKIVAENLSKKELKFEKPSYCHNNYETNNNAKSKTSNHRQHFLNDSRNKTSNSRPEKKKKQQFPKRQSSKLSICSSNGSISSDEGPYRNSEILKTQHIQRHTRCHSPSMLNYLVCQSERDINQN